MIDVCYSIQEVASELLIDRVGAIGGSLARAARGFLLEGREATDRTWPSAAAAFLSKAGGNQDVAVTAANHNVVGRLEAIKHTIGGVRPQW